MKKLIGIALVLFVAMGSGAFAATSVTDTVGVSYDVTGTVVLLGITALPDVSLSLNGGSYGAAEAGARATLGGGSSSVEALGPYLHYTTYGVVDQKITAQKDSTTAAGYANDSLSVKINAFAVGGSLVGTLGAKYTNVPTEDYQAIGATVRTLITGISGVDTWTGTGATQGAQLKYKLSAAPGVPEVVVLYTILANS